MGQLRGTVTAAIDSGFLHGLLNLPRRADVEGHPKAGASWEGFVIEQIASHLRAEPEECVFWATHTGAELDMLVVRGGERRAFEIKRTSSPRVTPSMRSAPEDLRLDGIDVIHAGNRTFDVARGIRAVALPRVLIDIQPLQSQRDGAVTIHSDSLGVDEGSVFSCRGRHG
jgi:predicted AAA+ superfamily ATPase